MMNPVTLPDSAYYDISSTINAETYRVFIGGIQTGQSNPMPRPVVFVLDGNWLFASVYEYLRTLSLFDPSIGNPLVVGIGYPTDDTMQILTRRERDLAPVTENIPNTAQFLAFLTGQVPELLETELGIPANRKILAGHSWGGAFTLYALGSNTSSFSGYLASSPLVLGTVLEDIEQYIQNLPIEKQTKLFSSMGVDEASMFPQITRAFPHLKKALDQFAPENLIYRLVTFEDENHSSITLTALTRGLRFLLS